MAPADRARCALTFGSLSISERGRHQATYPIRNVSRVPSSVFCGRDHTHDYRRVRGDGAPIPHVPAPAPAYVVHVSRVVGGDVPLVLPGLPCPLAHAQLPSLLAVYNSANKVNLENLPRIFCVATA